MNSMTYAHDSKSFLIPIVNKYLKRDDLNFFAGAFLPLI